MILKVPNYTNTDSDLTFSVNRKRKIKNLEKSSRKFSHRPKSEQYIARFRQYIARNWQYIARSIYWQYIASNNSILILILQFLKNQYWYWYWQYQYIAAIYCSAIYWFVSLIIIDLEFSVVEIFHAYTLDLWVRTDFKLRRRLFHRIC